MTQNKCIKVTLQNDELEFLKRLADRDGVSLAEEMKILFNLQLREEMDLYYKEFSEKGT